MVIILAMASFSLTAGAAEQTDDVSATLRALNANTLISSATKTTADTTCDYFKWTGGTTQNLNVWIENEDDYIVGPKVKFAKAQDKFIKIPYRTGITFNTNATAYMYAEQSSFSSKTLFGCAKYS